MQAIWDVLHPIHMPVPTLEHFLDIAEEFQLIWDFPHCLGAVDGRHMRIKCPANSGSLCFNYKHFYSIVLQAHVDAHQKFITIDVGGFGKQSDGGTFRASKLFKCLEEKLLQIPHEDYLPNSDMKLPYFLVGDGAYPLSSYLMKPYRGLNLSQSQENFNRRLSKARQVVERAFGMQYKKWEIYHKPIELEPEGVTLLTQCTCVIHNVILDLENVCSSTQVQTIDLPLPLHDETQDDEGDESSANSIEIRSLLTDYFMEN